MKITAATLKRIAAMPAEAMAEALLFLAEQLEADEAKRNATAMRQQRYRERHSSVTVTPKSRDSDEDVTLLARVEDNIINIPSKLDIKNLPLSPSKAVSATDPDGFDAFWSVYPKRDGAMDRKSAVKAFAAARKRASLTTIIEGAQHFAQAMTARGKVGTEFIPQPRTWLNGDRWNDRYDAGTSVESKEAQWLAVLKKHAAPSRS